MKNNKKQITIIILLLVLVAVIASSCVTERKRLKICQTCPIQVKDSIVVREVDRPVEVLVNHTVTEIADNPCADLCDSLGRLKPFKKTYGSGNVRTTISTNNGSLSVSSEIKDLKAQGIAKDLLIEKYRSEQVPARCEREHLTKWDSFFIIVGRIALLLIAGLLVKWKFF